MQLTSFFSRGRTRPGTETRGEERAIGTPHQRGFVVPAALLIALLYFALMELLLLDSARALQDSQRFRARIVAGALAEDGAELAAAGMTAKGGNYANRDDAQGTVTGKYLRSGNNFELSGSAESKGIPPAKANVRLQGRVLDGVVIIDYSTHSQ